jgi:hypothetical protein
MKKTLLFISICVLLFSVVAEAQFQQLCPTVPYTWGPGGGLTPSFARYNDGSSPSSSFNPSTSQLTVTWPHNGDGFVAFVDVGVEIHIPFTILGSITFTSAPELFCNGQTQTYSVSDNCGTSFTWTAPAGWSINSGGNTLTTSSPTVSITAPSSGSAQDRITVTSNISGTIHQDITLGSPAPYVSSQDVSTQNGHTIMAFTATAVPNATYKWYVNGSWINTTSSNYFEYYIACDLTKNFKCTMTTTCSSTPSPYSSPIYVTGACLGGGGGKGLSISPNPASSQLLISTADPTILGESATSMNAENFDAKLYSPSGLLLKSGASRHGRLTFDVNDVPAGEYYIHIFNGAEIIQRHVQIKK